jgi:anti-sigma regulatory factor (Ser/Thr protein kinase)
MICDAFLPSFEAARQVLQSTRDRFPAVRLALLTGYATEQLLPLMMDQDITQAWIKNVPFDYAEFGLLVKQLLTPGVSFGLANQLEGTPETFDAFETIHVTSSHQIAPCLSRFRELLSTQQVDSANEMMTCFAEALTNAVYHAPRNTEGEEKYKKLSTIEQLLPSETVTVQMGADSQKVGFSVQDQFGALLPKTLLYWLHRHQTGNGLLDTHGRGLYLMHSLADRLVVSLSPGKKTDFTLLSYKTGFKAPVGDKPILIHLLPEAEHSTI